MANAIKEALQQSMAKNGVQSSVGLTLRNSVGQINCNSLGYQIALDTLTAVRAQVIDQKFYEVAPADYAPLTVGEGSFAQNILTGVAISTSGDFEEGNINQGSGNSRLATADIGITSITTKIINWAKSIGYTVFELEQALRAENWDIIASKHSARKKNWDLGIQEMMFLGSSQDGDVKGLFTQTGVNVDETTIPKAISAMNAAEFATFVKSILAAYQANCAYTAMPNVFVIPQDDFLGLTDPLNTTYPSISKLDYLNKAFAQVVAGGVSILPSVYGMLSKNAARGISKNRYAMYRYDADTLRMDIPVDYTITAADTANNFQFQDVSYGQYSGITVYRPLEVLYFDWD